MMDKYV
jgi:hypothetical protein